MTAGRGSRFGTVAVLITTVTALGAITVALWSGGFLNSIICGGDCGALAVSTPEDLALDPVAGDTTVRSTSPRTLDAAAIHAAVDDLLDDSEHLGDRVGFAVVDPQTADVVTSTDAGKGFIPASTTKVLTALTVLATVGPQQRFTTSVVRSGDTLVLVGGGDPYLASEPAKRSRFAVEADIETLARKTVSALRQAGVSRVRLDYDATRFNGPAVNPAWEESYLTEKLVTPISALWVDQGVVNGVRTDDPAKRAAQAFAEELEDAGLSVAEEHRSVSAPADATAVATVRSATVSRLTEQMVEYSDNETAEVLLRQAAIAAGNPGSFAGGVAAMVDVLRARGIDTAGLQINDGSGLSRKNRIAPVTLAQAIAEAAKDPRTASLVAGLPAAKFSGTLIRRFGQADDGRGVVRAKTGTLKGVHSLAGYVTDREGAPIPYAVMVDATEDLSSVEVEAALDRVSAALADCTCSTASN